MQSQGIDLIHTFVVVAEELSFRRSAELLNVDPSALTRRIRKLEDLLGFPLFERTTRAVTLTPAGQAFYDGSVRVLRDYDASITTAQRIAEGKAGHLRVAYMSFAAVKLVPQAVARFRAQHPHVDVSLRYVRTQGQRIALATDEIDIGYMIGPFDHTDFHCVTVNTEPLYLVMQPAHPLAEKDELSAADIDMNELILGDMVEWESFRWHLEGLFSRLGKELKPKLEATNILALAGLVAAGLGVMICPADLAFSFGSDVTIRKIAEPDFKIDTVLVWSRLNRSRLVRDFVDVATAREAKT